MVPVNATLLRTIDARKVHDGYGFQAKLMAKAKLADGTELPEGTILMGEVVQDELNMPGMARVALRIDRAKTKDGRVIPVKATLVGIFGAGNTMTDSGSPQPNTWTDASLQIDQIDAMPGVDLHSRVAGRMSGVFVSTTKDDVKLDAGSELQLALTENAANAMANGAPSSSPNSAMPSPSAN